MFVDQAEILVTAGAGGDGCQAFAKPPFSRHARPSGGNGGDGGDVVLVADPQLTTLLDFQFQHEFRAARGRHGSGNNKTGKRGDDCVVRVPVGTVVYDAKAFHLLRDLITPFERLLVAHGGAGGVGNATLSTLRRTSFAQGRSEQRRTTTSLTSCRARPSVRGRVASRVKSRDATTAQATPGKPGEGRRLRLELRLIADVGLVGFPNAGKSSLLARISTARPKIAPYPFTTRTPVLGVVSVGRNGSFVACDIPGLIEGAHEGRGLGMQFLRHIERTRLLVHVIDMAAVDGRDPVTSFRQLNEELAAYTPIVSQRPQLVAANKMDLPEAQEHLKRFQAQTGVSAVPISCVTGMGVRELVQVVWQRLQTFSAREPALSSHG